MIIAFAPIHDKSGINPKNGRPWKDATHAFIPEAKAFLRHHKQPESDLVMVDNSKSPAEMKRAVYAALDREPRKKIHGVAFFCHGLKDRIQFGIRQSDIPEFAEKMVKHADPALRVTFYACDAGRDNDGQRDDDLEQFGGDNGFADRVRDELCRHGNVRCVVDAHTTAAHTTMNPHVRRFEGMGSPVGGIGGYYIVPRGAKVWGKWVKALKTDLRFAFPYLTTAEIHRLLAK